VDVKVRGVLLGVVLLLVACTSSGNFNTRMPILADLTRSESIQVNVTHGSNAGSGDWKLEEKLVRQLKRVGKFRQVLTSSGGQGDLTLSVNAVKMPRGGFWDRSIFGRGEVQLDVQLVDNATGNVIGSCVVNAESTLGVLWSSSGGRAVDRAVENVAKFITQT
jgi:hypothetical protein